MCSSDLIQVFLQGKLLGIRPFLLAPGPNGEVGVSQQLYTGRAYWITLLSEVVPRALLAELGLARVLLGSSGGGGFLLLYCPAERQEEVRQALVGYREMPFALERDGSKVIFNVRRETWPKR